MNSVRTAWLIALLVLVASVHASAESMLAAWRSDPFSFQGGIVFGGWAVAIFQCQRTNEFAPGIKWVCLSGMLFGAASVSGLSVLHHLGLATIAASFVPRGINRWFALGSSIAWLPALGWVAHSFLEFNANAIRVPLAIGLGMLLLRLTGNLRIPAARPASASPLPPSP